MRTCAPTVEPTPLRAHSGEQGLASPSQPEAGFTLIEMLVAMVLLSLVGLTLARFQTFQLSGAASLAASAGARLEADNRAVDVLAAPTAPAAGESGSSQNAGRSWYWIATPGPSPDPMLMPDLVRVDIAVSLTPDGPAIATRSVLRPRGNPPVVARS